MEVNYTTETIERTTYETDTHYFKISPDALNAILDGKEPAITLYKRISKSIKAIDNVDAGDFRDKSRDAIFKHIMPDEQIPYLFNGKQMVLADYAESKDAPNIEAEKEKNEAEA